MGAKEILDAFTSTIIPSILPAIISYLIARYKGKMDIKKVIENNKAEIEKLVKQHEVDLEALKEKHKMEMELKDKEQEHKLQLMQVEAALQVNQQQKSKENDIMTSVLGGLFGDFLTDPSKAIEKIEGLQKLADAVDKLDSTGDKK